MSEAGEGAWRDALLTLACLEAGAGGMVLKARHGPVRDRFLQLLAAQGRALYRLSPESDVGPLRGERDLLASLAAGRALDHLPLAQRCAERVLLVSGAERIEAPLRAILLDLLDAPPPGCAVVLVDESEDEGALAEALDHRLPISLALDGLSLAQCAAGTIARQPETLGEEVLPALVEACARLGIADPRIALHALTIARTAAGVCGTEAALGFAGRRVLAPRATRLPEQEGEEQAPPPTDSPETPDSSDAEEPAADDARPQQADGPPEDHIVEAARAMIDPALLRQRQQAAGKGTSGSVAARAGTGQRGRKTRTRRGRPGEGKRLDLIATLVAAAPEQHGRHESAPGSAPASEPGSAIAISARHLRVSGREPRQRQATIFTIDASGSAALARLAEVKGAVETLLAESYIRRDEAALVAFRAGSAELVLPRTRSLARASRLLSGLAGGGGTPLAAGIMRGMREALLARAAGRSPLLVVVTDGDANQALDGAHDRAGAKADALAAARDVARLGLAGLVVDCGARPRPFARELAAAMQARYFALPRMERTALSSATQAARAA